MVFGVEAGDATLFCVTAVVWLVVAEPLSALGAVDVFALFVALDVVRVVVVVAFFCGAGGAGEAAAAFLSGSELVLVTGLPVVFEPPEGACAACAVVALVVGAGFDADSTYGSDQTGPKTMAVAAIKPTSACSHLTCAEDFLVRRGTACTRCTPLVSLSDAGVRRAVFGNNLN
jgi:hypothetical protein